MNDGPDPTLKQATSDALLEDYIRLRDFLAAQAKAFAEWGAPHKARMTQIEQELHGRLLALGGESPKIATGSGTAYFTTTKNPKIENRDDYLKFVGDNWSTYGNAMLQLGAPQVAALNEYQDAHDGALPPGVKTEPFIKVTIRKG